MNDKVVPIKPPVKIETKEGLTKCLRCKHEWVGESPVGTKWLDCPACGEHYGHPKGTVERGGLHWQCKCGSQLFFINTTAPYCIECGEYQYPT